MSVLSLFRLNKVFLAIIIIAAWGIVGCDSNLTENTQTTEYRAGNFMLPKRIGSQTMFRITQITVDSNGMRDTSIIGALSYTMADTAYRFSPNLKATLILAGESDSLGKFYGYDSIYAFMEKNEIRLSTYYSDSIGRRLVAEPIRPGATFKRTDDSLPSSIVTIEAVNAPVITQLRTFSAVKTIRRYVSEIDSSRRELIFENYLAPGHFLVKQVSTDAQTNLRTGKSDTSIIQYNLFFKNF